MKQDRNLHMTYFTGIDIGSTSAKTIVMDDKQNICLRMLQPTGWSCVDTAGEILRKLEAEGIKRESMKIVATGYGRAAGEHCLRRGGFHRKQGSSTGRKAFNRNGHSLSDRRTVRNPVSDAGTFQNAWSRGTHPGRRALCRSGRGSAEGCGYITI